jgi:hypothetical protein
MRGWGDIGIRLDRAGIGAQDTGHRAPMLGHIGWRPDTMVIVTTADTGVVDHLELPVDF